MKTIFVVVVSIMALTAGCLGGDGGGDDEGSGGWSSGGVSAERGPEMACVKVKNTFGCGDPRTETWCEAVYSKSQCQSSRTSPVYLDSCAFYSSTSSSAYAMTCEEWRQKEND